MQDLDDAAESAEDLAARTLRSDGPTLAEAPRAGDRSCAPGSDPLAARASALHLHNHKTPTHSAPPELDLYAERPRDTPDA